MIMVGHHTGGSSSTEKGGRREIKVQEAEEQGTGGGRFWPPVPPTNRAPNERNAKGSSVTINFLSSWGEETYSKTKKIKLNFADVLRCTTTCSNYKFFTLQRKLWVSPGHFCSNQGHSIGRGFTNSTSKSYCTQYITIFVFLTPGSWNKFHLKANQSSCLERKILHQRSLKFSFCRLTTQPAIIFKNIAQQLSQCLQLLMTNECNQWLIDEIDD